MTELVILDPRAQSGVPVTPYGLRADVSRPGLRVALLSNGFFDATKLLNAVGNALQGQLPGAQIRLFERADASIVADATVIAEIAGASDVVITALGHCGSCTSSATRDAVNIARAGVPVTALISEKFWGSAAFVARSVGMPDVPRVKLPHPVAGTGTVRINEIAAAAAPNIVAVWKDGHVH